MHTLRALYRTGALLLLLCVLIDAIPMNNPDSTALDIRPRGDLETVHQKQAFDLVARTANGAMMVGAPIIAMASLTLSTCRYLHIAMCYLTWSLTLAVAMSYFGYTFYDMIKRDWIRNQREMQQLANQVALSNNDVDAATRRLETEKTKDAYDLWKNKQEMRTRTWKDTWKPKFDVYKDLGKAHPSLETDIEKAEKLMDQTIKAEENFIKAELASASLDDVLDGKEGTLSIAELRALEEKAETAVKDLGTALKNIINADTTNLEMMNEMAFGNKDYNPLLEHYASRRSLHTAMLPRLVTETNTDCDNQLCHRMWYSLSIPDRGKKRAASPSDVIHNIYSTPVDYEFDSNRVLRRRDTLVLPDDEDMECEWDEDLNIDDQPVMFRMASKPGNDTDSLLAIDQLNNTQQAMFKDSIMKTNMTIWGSGEWTCVNGDSDDGGAPAIRGVAIFTQDMDKLHQDVGPLFSKCESILPGTSTS
ncbi:uncharacterized protein N7459_008164 [Penicillium hispanicum]|uniref:uncharacterized protein n=1 Tax=Penicillium hispanicum TaxID=1080232 RepID=UPI0025402BF6|nr:uncharacterized protein N7459_008164 [Penicillium hispanicum]KAJ5573737.1 hypothetical protein N7459_008164 [Penicillium hispanicum]